ncbi:MAG TPA: SET domain-containing protein-lysine N-methyltransferase [Flavisolibacter sp.]|jgi:SET domain-containing protein|nr:SET domain-containing protein-lysine N-methyltransferase [Flavisolibacter sp.]
MALLEKDLEIKPSTIPGAGKGLFTKTSIAKGTRIVEYKGEIKTWDEVRLEHSNAYIYFLKPNYIIDARNHPNTLARYVNDAKGLVQTKGKTNNAQFMNDGLRVYLVATKNIAEEEEILVAYGKAYWDTVRANNQIDNERKRVRST